MIILHGYNICSFRNFGNAEEILTRALSKTEELFGLLPQLSLVNWVICNYSLYLSKKKNYSLHYLCSHFSAPICWYASDLFDIGSHHSKVGVVLTCIALMFRRKAMEERSSSLLIQEVRTCAWPDLLLLLFYKNWTFNIYHPTLTLNQTLGRGPCKLRVNGNCLLFKLRMVT